MSSKSKSKNNWRYKQRRDPKFQNKHKGATRNNILRNHMKEKKRGRIR